MIKRPTSQPNLLTIPPRAAVLLLTKGGVHHCPPLRSEEFLRFCTLCGIAVNETRLLHFERLGIFMPLFRVYRSTARQPLRLPLATNRWFRRGYAVDTTLGKPHAVPAKNGSDSEAYYSRFQIASLLFALGQFTTSINLEEFLDEQLHDDALLSKGAQLKKIATHFNKLDDDTRQFRPAIDLLCQFISDRYFPHTRSNQRTREVSQGGQKWDQWMVVGDTAWRWEQYARAWDPSGTKRAFKLTPDKLRHAYEALSVQQSHHDPLEHWYQLVQFTSPRERDRLKGNALCSQAMRGGALMLRLLYRDLYDEQLPDPNEVRGTILSHVPELAVRADARRHMELITNRFDLNSAPKLTLFVEGASEEVAVKTIFERYFGAHVGTHQIEVINLGGVDNATGGKKMDRFRAILRLVDYLHHHQTFTFLILDNENNARKLKEAARNQASTLHDNRYATRPEYIKIWRSSFEFDNFSATEIARAMTALARGNAAFSPQDIMQCKKSENPGARLSDLYSERTSAGLNKIDLSTTLVEMMFDSETRKVPANRPLIITLARVVRLAAKNPFPTMQEVWERNQISNYLGRTRIRVRRKPKKKRHP